jgi:hypothetical protein
VLSFHAGQGDHCQCADCHLFFPGGDLYTYPHGNICECCHEDRRDLGVTREAFGSSPRHMASMELAVAFPPKCGFRGACTTIADVSRHGLYAGHLGLTPTKRAAVRLIIMAHMQNNEATGHGNRAKRRMVQVSMAQAYRPYTAEEKAALASYPHFPLTPEDVNRMAALEEETHTEGHVSRRPFRTNPHE